MNLLEVTHGARMRRFAVELGAIATIDIDSILQGI